MRKFNLERRKALAQKIIENPARTMAEYARELYVNVSVLYTYLDDADGALAFLKAYGPDMTESSLIEIARTLLKTWKSRRGVGSKLLRKSLARLPAIVVEHRRQTYLTEKECHWLVNHEPPVYCKKDVDGLYCAEHSRIAERLEAGRFEIAQREEARAR